MTGYCKVTGGIQAIENNAIGLGLERIMVRKHAHRKAETTGARHAIARFARLSPFRRVTLCLQIIAIAVLVTAVPGGALVSSELHSDGRSQAFAAIGLNCAATAGDSAPARPREAHAQCCVICNGAARELLALFIASACLAAFSSARKTSTLIDYFFNSISVSPVPGWASSWSSRAPPVLD